MSRMEKGDRHRCSGNIKMMEYWSNGVMEKNGYRLRVTGYELTPHYLHLATCNKNKD